MASESALEKKCRLHAEALGWRLLKIRTPGTKGFPDRLLIAPGILGLVEFKSPTGKGRLSRMQASWLHYLGVMMVPRWLVSSFSQFVVVCTMMQGRT